MLSLFPDLYSYGFVAPAFLRLVLASFFLWQGLKFFFFPKQLGLPGSRVVGLFDFLLGIFVLIGLYTQAILLLVLLELFGYLLAKRLLKQANLWSNSEILLLASIALALLVLGPGLWAFDLPL